MISKNNIKLIRSLELKKFRLAENLFLAEGNKLVTDILESALEVEFLFATEAYLESAGALAGRAKTIVTCSHAEIRKASLLKNPQQCLALCRIPAYTPTEAQLFSHLVLCLDNIQDPGNLGTIMRTADWFGISDIVCSVDSADLFNPKAVQATMGAICRVRVHYRDLTAYLEEANQRQTPVFGAFLDGENIYQTQLADTGIVVLGNEGRGIGPELTPLISHKIHIPAFSPPGQKVESLNISVAAAVFCSEFRGRSARRQ